MKKVATHFGFFMRTISDNLKPGSNNVTKQMFFAAMEAEYPPDEGWEIVSTIYTGQQPEGYTIGFGLTQYEYIE